MSLSKKQKSLYWRTFGAVCAEQGWTGKERDARRKAITKQAGLVDRATGEARSMTTFGNTDLDRFLAECAKYLGAHTAAATTEARERKRLIWRIEKDAARAALNDEYLSRVATDLTGLGCWRELAIDQLENFRNVIHNRAAGKRPAPPAQRARKPAAERQKRRRAAGRPAMRQSPETAAALAALGPVPGMDDDDNIPF
jgi:hypothetical protein